MPERIAAMLALGLMMWAVVEFVYWLGRVD